MVVAERVRVVVAVVSAVAAAARRGEVRRRKVDGVGELVRGEHGERYGERWSTWGEWMVDDTGGQRR